MVDDKNKKPEEKPSRNRFLRRLGSFVKWAFVLGIMGVLFAGGALTGYIASIVKDEPVRTRAAIEQAVGENALTGFAYFADGSPIGQLRTEEDRRIVGFEDIPQKVIDAVISIEDDSFYEHKGVDITGTMRAVKERVLNEPVQTGGSTLTQQLARRVFLNLDKTEDRKVKELLLSLRLERFLTKDEIITAYLNKVPFGNGSSGYNVYGIKAAAKGIFNINDLNDLNIAQAAYLAGLPQLPSSYSAFNGKGDFNEKNFNNAIERQERVLGRMLALGKISQSEHDEALAFDIKSTLAPKVAKAYNTYPYLMLETERQAAKVLIDVLYPETAQNGGATSEQLEQAQLQLRTGGYRVYTTINKNVYKTMRTIAEDDSNFSAYDANKGLEQTASMMIDHKTGKILGMIEGRDFNVENMNYATQMVRQPGSAMKPIAAYLPALEAGLIQPASIIDDSPIILKDGGKGFHIPKNSNGRYSGLVTARYALNQSLNVPALKLFNEEVGMEKAWNFSKSLGITTLTENDYTNATTGVLGGLTHGVTVEELTNAYGAIANNGVFNDAYMVEKIVDYKGNIVYSHKAEPEQVFSEQTAYLMTDMLRTVISDGTGKVVRDNFNKYGDIAISGKTGTTQNYGDVWFEGSTPDVTLGVWVGYKTQANTLETKAQKERARRLWAKIMSQVSDQEPDLFTTKSFTKPDGITTKTVSAYSGKLPTSVTDKFVTDMFNAKFVPTEYDDAVAKAKYITYNGVNYIPRDETPSDMLKEQTVVKRKRPISDLIKELQTAFKQMSSHESLSYYLPTDADDEMPKEVDPRRDDGSAPDAPGNVRISLNNDNAVITFNPSGASDVVGYRLYRSMYGGPFQNQGKVVLAGNSTTFSSYAGSGAQFYIVAVDVAGKESAPSAVVGGVTTTPTVPPEETPDDGGTIEVPGEVVVPEDNADGETNTEQPPANSVPAAPSGVTAQVTDQGIMISWAAQEGVTSFNVYYSETGQEPFNLVGSAGFTSFKYNNSEAKGAFRVAAVNAAGESPHSAAVSVGM